MNATLIFTPDGHGKCVHTEMIDLRTIGRLTVKRYTSIVFDHVHQYWRVKNPRRFQLYASPSRQACLDWERRYLEALEDRRHGGI